MSHRLLLCALLAGVVPAPASLNQTTAGRHPAFASLRLPAHASPALPSGSQSEVARWEQQAQGVTIIRDTWGIPHIYGKTDADVVFGMLYAQAEDDFHRLERNYVNAMGRLAETAGEAELYRDLRMKLFVDPRDLQARYTTTEPWLKKLMVAFADGLNFYLYKHPEVKPEVIKRFEPWMALSFTEGSIGGDIESINLGQLQQLYGAANGAAVPQNDGNRDSGLGFREQSDRSSDDGREPEPSGSNGMAIAPRNSASGHSLLLINPHTSFYFRAEAQLVSEEGLNTYGAATWGQFFIYQGFNERVGWMHTSTGGDVIDEYVETIVKKPEGLFYKYGNETRPVTVTKLSLPYKTATGMATRDFTVYKTHHGPIVRAADGKWIAVHLMFEPVKALTQSYSRTKATDYKSFAKVMELRTNTSNNTVYADADGNIAYWHGNFIPVRDTQFNFSRPVDGSDPRTDWKGLHTMDQTITLFNPASGWLFNTNNWPFSAAGPSSPKREKFPAYMFSSGENARGLHAVRVLSKARGLTLDGLIAAANDTYLTAFEEMMPALLTSYDALPASDPAKESLKEQIALLRPWDLRYSLTSTPTSLAIYWAEQLMSQVGGTARRKGMSVFDYMAKEATTKERLDALTAASAKLTADFGSWKTPWGEINRYQRLSGDIDEKFDDAKPSIPVVFPSATWGSLAAYGYTGPPQHTKKIYGNRGNSFIAVVEFGKQVKAKAVSVGGESGNPSSPHFRDQAQMYASSTFRDVWFYRPDVDKHVEKKYHPGN